MEIISREWWGAEPPKRTPFRISTPTPKLYLHHAAGSILPGDDSVSNLDLQRIRSIQHYHQNIRGWNDIAYSFLTDPDGYVFEGRGAGIAGGHTKGQNTVSHAICVMGNYDVQKVDDDLVARIVELVRYGHAQGWWPNQITGGHRDAPLAATSCPGKNLYPLIPVINKLVLEEDNMTPAQESALNTLVALLDSRAENPPPWGAGNWTTYLDEVWTGPVTSDPGPLNPVTHVQLAKVYTVLKSAIEKTAPSGTDIDAVVAEIVDRLEE